VAPFPFTHMKYIYGPVKSRRLGSSLGINLMPYKICNFDCIYCQLGVTLYKVSEREEYVKIKDIIDELRLWLENNAARARTLRYITISGSGEPTLHIRIGDLIGEIKKIASIPVAVITNASLLNIAKVRQALVSADVIVPSLDAVDTEVFQKIDRPHKDLRLTDIINGLIKLRQEFSGEIWLEVMLVKGVNDDPRHIRRLKEIIERINPDKIQLNSPVRATAEKNVQPVDRSKLEKFKEILGDRCEII